MSSETDGSQAAPHVLEKAQDKESILKRARIASLSEERSPYLGYYGRYNQLWEVDAISFPHNSVRKQLNQLFASTNALGVMAMDVSYEDLEKFYTWYAAFHEFLLRVLHAEEHALYPHLSSLPGDDHPQLDKRLRKEARKLKKEQIIDKSRSLARTLQDGKTPSEIIEDLRDAADIMSVEVLRYFSLKEGLLPKMIRAKKRRKGGKRVVEHATVQCVLREPNSLRNMELLLSSLEKEEVRQDFIKRNVQNVLRRKKLIRALCNGKTSILEEVPRSFKRASSKYKEKYSVETFLTHYGSIQNPNGSIKGAMGLTLNSSEASFCGDRPLRMERRP